MVLEKKNNYNLNVFKNSLEKNICNFFFKGGKYSIVEFKFFILLKKMKKNGIQKPFFYIWKQIYNFLLIIKLIKIKSQPRRKKYYIKNLTFDIQFKNSIKFLMLNKKEFKFFYYRLNNLNHNLKKRFLRKIEKNKFNILDIKFKYYFNYNILKI